MPPELVKKYKGKHLDVGLEDKRGEEYVPPPPPKYTAYSGHGAAMGKVEGVGLEVNKDNGKPVVDESKPKTKIAF